MKRASALIAVSGLAGAASANSSQVGDFVWTLNDTAGGSGNANGGTNTLNITGGDSGFGGETSLTAIAFIGSTVFATAVYDLQDASVGFDFAFYEVNGNNVTFASTDGTTQITFLVSAGDSFGFGVSTVDGIFGPGVLTISDFRFGVPAPGTLALLGLAGIAASRRRR